MSTLTGLHEAIDRLDAVWAGAADAAGLSRAELIAVNDAVGLVQRTLAGVQAEVAARIAWESRAELGAESLAKQHGFRTPATLIAATTGVSTGDAVRLVRVGEATAPRADLVGAPLPAKYPVVREALASGKLSAPAAAVIVGVLDACRVAAGQERTAEAEQVLVERAQGLTVDDVRKLAVRAQAWLDPGGVEGRERERRDKRALTMFERDGMVHLNAVLDAETAAPVVTAIRGYVSAAFAARKDVADAGASGAGAGAGAGAGVAGAGVAGAGEDRRTVPMIQADALAAFCAHVTGCESRMPLAGATVVVRMSLDDLKAEDGASSGFATVDGLDQPVSVGAARRMAASGGVIPCVLGGDGEVLDWGREKRLFTRVQRLALVERDGGCAMCGLPPEMTKAHHIRWWKRDHGPTDLSNGVLLCETCHHRIHDNGWEIRVGPLGSDGRSSAGERRGSGEVGGSGEACDPGDPGDPGVAGGSDGSDGSGVPGVPGGSGGSGGSDGSGGAGGPGGASGTDGADGLGGSSVRVWFIPPAFVDPTRTPRPGGRARFDIAA